MIILEEVYHKLNREPSVFRYPDNENNASSAQTTQHPDGSGHLTITKHKLSIYFIIKHCWHVT